MKTKSNEIKRLDRIGGGKSQSKSVYSSEGISPCLISQMWGNTTVPYIIEITKVKKNEDK